MFDLPALEEAARLVHGVFPPTPQYAWPLLARRTGAEVWVKHENHTPTGAYKVRGGLNLLATRAAASISASVIIGAPRAVPDAVAPVPATSPATGSPRARSARRRST